ncbi:MAG: rRNA maturation RNase YbeY [Lachnospiraceae bacterium]|nr:rRNA maturation RNase YbeY [Lachnospiraceae bacterium]
MMVFLENETSIELNIDYLDIAEQVVSQVLINESCPFEAEVNILLTDNKGIHDINLSARDIDSPTDVLSFPNLFFDKPALFQVKEEEMADIIDPETDLVILGDIIINLERVISQAVEYGHSKLREYAFLIAHSMYHLCGYDHMTEDEAKEMEKRQELALSMINITREIPD